MFPFERFVAMVMLALLVTAAMALFILGGGSGQLRSFANAASICESAYAGACFNTGKAPVTWDTPTQNLNGAEKACSEILNCSCAGAGSSGSYACAMIAPLK